MLLLIYAIPFCYAFGLCFLHINTVLPNSILHQGIRFLCPVHQSTQSLQDAFKCVKAYLSTHQF